MKTLFVLLFIVAALLLPLISVSPAKAETPSINQQYCAWVNQQTPVVSTFGGWSIYDVNPVCARAGRIEWVTVGDGRGRDYVSVESNSLAQWAAKLGGK